MRTDQQFFGSRGDWPVGVVPETNEQIEAAVAALCGRALWRYDRNGRELILLLTPWYRAEWTNAAIMHALDHDPMGEWRAPWTSQAGDLVEFVAKRLRVWRTSLADEATPCRPPAAGVPAHRWLARMREQQTLDARPRAHTQSGPAGPAPRRSQQLPLQRLRDRQDRRVSAMADLEKYLPATTVSATTTTAPSDGYRDSRVDLTNLPLIADPAVLRALVLVAAQPQPERHLLARLRNAMRHARTQMALERLTAGATASTTPSATDLAALLAQVVGPDGQPLRYDDVARRLGNT